MPPVGVIAVGLVLGALGALNSLGMILLWRTTRLVNLAQPSMGLVGGVVTGLLVTSAKWSFAWAFPVGLLVGALLGLFTDRIALRRLEDAPRAVLLVVTIGLAGIFGGIQAAIPFAILGHPLVAYPIDLGIHFYLRGGNILGAHIAVMIALPICLVGAHLFLHRTKFGLSALALGQDQERARALGVPASAVRSLVWAIAGVLATVSGIFAVPIRGFQLGGALEATVLLFALAPAVFAGFRSLTRATVAALALGVVFNIITWYTSKAGIAQLILAASLLVAIAVQGRRLGRGEAAQRASSWEAAATVRPSPSEVRNSSLLRLARWPLAVVLVAAGFWAPNFLSPSAQVIYGAGAALALGALSIVAAWMFAGEVAIGQWGFAGLGAAIACLLPGPWPYRVVVASILMGVGGALLGAASRRRTNLQFAVLGLAAAVAGPVAVFVASKHRFFVDTKPAASAAGATLLIALVGIIWLRSSIFGARLVAARDDPQRGPWLGAHPVPSRMISLGISIGLAGLAGGLTVANSRVSLVAGSSESVGAFDFILSLDILAMAVLGGLGSPTGSVIAAALIIAGRYILPSAWVLIVSGLGITLVVIFQPAGLSRFISLLRDQVFRLVVRSGPTQRTKPSDDPVRAEV